LAQAEKSTRRTTARQPQRRPGQLRFQKLLDALDALLRDNNVQEVGLYQIAEQAGVPSASVYHFFPSKEAAFMALATVHHQALQELSQEPLPARPANWQELCREKVSAAARYHNDHPAALRLFLGANISVEIKSADMSQYLRLAQARADMLDQYVAEAQQAGIAYLRCYLPELVAPRS
jgi:AcrR family transcriptional regulator